jgi:ComF family protein
MSRRCSRCVRSFQLSASSDSEGVCEACLRNPPPFDAVRSFGTYEGHLRRLIHLFKYNGMTPLARPLAERLAAAARDLGPLDAIVPIPLHGRRRWSRGFNQAALLAGELSARTGIPARPKALRRVRPTAPQAGLSDDDRQRNMSGAFRVAEAASVRGSRILLVDDVMTTGSTLAAASQALKTAGASRVTALTVAYAERHSGLSTPSESRNVGVT